MGLAETLQKRIRPRKATSDDEAVSNAEQASNTSDTGAVSSTELTEADISEKSEDEHEVKSPHCETLIPNSLLILQQSKTDDESRASNEEIEEGAGSISFGALAKVQETLGKRKRTATEEHDPSLACDPSSPSKRLHLDTNTNPEALERLAGKQDFRDFARSSKHAPAETSSKKAVSRRREVVPVIKIDHRDPRFEPLSGPVDESKTKKNYAFLEDYRDSEIAELKTAVRKTRDTDAKEKLKRALLSMESRKKAQKTKDQQQEIVQAHRAKEKELIKLGKKPYYLKEAQQRKMALVERFEGMKGKQVDKVIERRRKKKAGRERKGMPEGRRGVEG